MAHVFLDSPAGPGLGPAVNLVGVPVGGVIELGVWGASVNGQTLTVTINNSSIATLATTGVGSGPNLRHIKVRGLATGLVLFEARLGPGGAVWASTQLAVSTVVSSAITADEPSELAVLALEIARQEARKGVFETNNDNVGPEVDQYETNVGIGTGQSWCAAFVYWCFTRAAADLGVSNPLPRVGAVQALLNWATAKEKLVTNPKPGDLLIVKPHQHTGIVAGLPMSTGTIASVEGNTWAKTTYANRKEGVYELSTQKVAKLTFVRV